MSYLMEKSEFKREIFKVLVEWNHLASKATPFNISKKVNCSESTAIKVLRLMSSEGVAKSTHGSWHLT